MECEDKSILSGPIWESLVISAEGVRMLIKRTAFWRVTGSYHITHWQANEREVLLCCGRQANLIGQIGL